MLDLLTSLKELLLSVIREEWFWAIVAVIITLVSFIIQMVKENEISRANFIYNISNDYGNNDRILRVYEWMEQCRLQNRNVTNYPSLTVSADTALYDQDSDKHPLTFVDIDTYINHFEVVYVILNSVNIKSIDELFQQRFLTFMFNPFIQKEELFSCFLPDENDFLLLRKWLLSIYKRNQFSCQAFIDYLNTFTCGSYELTTEALEDTKARWPLLHSHLVKKYLINYVYYICDPSCKYGYYEFSRKDTQKALRIIRPAPTDQEAILTLQKRVVDSMAAPQWFFPSTETEIHAALTQPQKYLSVQICSGSQTVAFACIKLEPTPEEDVYLDLEAHGIPCPTSKRCLLDTVFVDPDYRGYGIQKTLIEILCSWAATLGKRHICATVHPENRFSANNFINSGFHLVTETPISKYNSQRNVFTKQLSRKDTCKAADGSYIIYPYV